ncbi:cupin [Candidatus Roizmanbacteria bacterium]|nr:cupin [Candidatus Roizmanbacteria bacterium]
MLDKIDPKSFSNLSYHQKVEKPWGWEIHWTPSDLPYMGKILHVNANKRLSLQFHDKKQETWYIMNGRAKVIWDNKKGKLIETELEYGKGYTCCVGQRHRLVGITNCDVIEVSTPEIGTTYRLEDDYSRPNETEELRKKRKVVNI